MTAVLERGRASIVEPWRRLLAVRIVGPLVKIAVFAVITYVAAKLLFKQPPEGLFLYGAMLGTLYGLIGAGVILIYRSNRIINFAAGSMGAVPSVLFLLLMTVKGL